MQSDERRFVLQVAAQIGQDHDGVLRNLFVGEQCDLLNLLRVRNGQRGGKPRLTYYLCPLAPMPSLKFFDWTQNLWLTGRETWKGNRGQETKE